MEELWRKMEAQFRRALQAGMCRLFARCGEPTAEHFREITADVFSFFRVIDWDRGVAEDGLGNRLYSLHTAPPIAEETDRDVIVPTVHEAAIVLSADANALVPEIEIPTSRTHGHRDTEAEIGPCLASTSAPLDGVENEEVLTIKEAVALLKIGRSTLYTLLKDHGIKKVKFRRRTVINKKHLNKFIREKSAE